MNDLRRALSLLTTLPVRPDWDDPAPLGRSMAWYPAVGLLLGLLLVLLASVLHGAPPLLRAALLLLGWVALTGGLHLDGWADACDGLLATVDRAKRLEILRDPRIGSFGAIGLVVLLLLKLAALAHTPLAALLAAPVAARWQVVLAARWASARPGGLGDRFRAGLGARQQAAAAATAGLVALACGWVGVVVLVTATAVGHALCRFADRRLGGLTGDVYGAVIEASETAALVAAALLGHG